jgi:hypothetical protein
MGAHIKGRRVAGFRGPSSFYSLSLSLSRVSDPCPLAYKREVEDPHRGDKKEKLKYTHALA